jgi:hypothetical protein
MFAHEIAHLAAVGHNGAQRVAVVHHQPLHLFHQRAWLLEIGPVLVLGVVAQLQGQ